MRELIWKMKDEDYTRERHEWLPDDPEALNKRLREREEQRKKV